MAIRYIAKTDDYWLRVIFEPSKIEKSLPYGLKVNQTGITGGREHFQILEGVYKGTKASAPARTGQSYLTTNVQHCEPLVVRFNLTRQTIYFGPHGPYNAFSGGGHGPYVPVFPAPTC